MSVNSTEVWKNLFYSTLIIFIDLLFKISQKMWLVPFSLKSVQIQSSVRQFEKSSGFRDS